MLARHRENIPVKNFKGLKLQIFSPGDFSYLHYVCVVHDVSDLEPAHLQWSSQNLERIEIYWYATV